LFRAQDRDLVIAVGSDAQWRSCVRVLGLHDLERDERLATNSGRLAQRQRVVETIQAALVQRRAVEWLHVLDAAGVPCGVVKSVLEAIRDAGAVSAVTGMPSPTGGRVRRDPPMLDEHGGAVRRRGWDAFEVTA
jgi:crotonobetainyl-CoA:carnitine CoA-transferase CaiB-like acyl-CoA transferase